MNVMSQHSQMNLGMSNIWQKAMNNDKYLMVKVNNYDVRDIP